MPSPYFSQIRRAIEEQAQVHANYGGYRRLMCPHSIGYKNGREQALCYQFGGRSSSGLEPVRDPTNGPRDNWRCIVIDNLSELEVVPGPWYTARNHSRPSRCVDIVIAEYRPR